MDLLREQEDRMPVGHLLERLIMQTRYDARLLCRPGGRRRLANVRKLLQMANSDSVMGVRDFIRRLQDLEKLSDREGDAPTKKRPPMSFDFIRFTAQRGWSFPSLSSRTCVVRWNIRKKGCLPAIPRMARWERASVAMRISSTRRSTGSDRHRIARSRSVCCTLL